MKERDIDDSLSGKDFLVTFEDNSGLGEVWMDTALFRIVNELRDELSRRQNYGRGLPV